MAQQNSFDIVSQVDRAEIMNAINQTMKEVHQRFDFKGSRADVALEEKELVLSAEDETKLRNMNDILQQKLVRRGVPLKALNYGNVEPAAGGTVRQRAGQREQDDDSYQSNSPPRRRSVNGEANPGSCFAGARTGRSRIRETGPLKYSSHRLHWRLFAPFRWQTSPARIDDSLELCGRRRWRKSELHSHGDGDGIFAHRDAGA